eukprot:CAMPEP_0206232916 /NCGR_PEP_ID=MMETSP0047_2-20121206/11685_1 /ASSEMBLY_ACC=CAM_ASM_000192 /TAXON_ID=195065 /ORGANISM="Chroomonas mesostigmatica_cf, Strain CCMP1168" /LENGTH=528 /DNA_ID=CAMNT_0053656713 /DNA_START=28 /DNA_END=1614 /DNA_ORIENTATION=-
MAAARPTSMPKFQPADVIRGLVSKKKRRFEWDGFSLDLAYITPRIIAMGFPSEGVQATYRNSLHQVYRFFETRHPDAYRIYNLCSERTYDSNKFHKRVENIPFDDHNPPPFELMRPMCINVENFLNEDPDHVVAIHCKAGKGRTGVMIVAYLMHCKMCKTTEEALELYARMRTFNGKGVTIPSQLRYCKYFELNQGQTRPLKAVMLEKVVVEACPPSVNDATLVIVNGQTRMACGAKNVYKVEGSLLVEIPVNVHIVGDVHIFVHDAKTNKTWLGGDIDGLLCSFWLHSSFLESSSLRITKPELDGPPRKDKKHERMSADFAVRLHFDQSQTTEAVRAHAPNTGISGGESVIQSVGCESKGSSAEGSGPRLVMRSNTLKHLEARSPVRRSSSISGLKNNLSFRSVPGSENSMLRTVDEETGAAPPTDRSKNTHTHHSLLSESLPGSADSTSHLCEGGGDPAREGIVLFDFEPPLSGDSDERLFLRVRANDLITLLKLEDGWWLAEFDGQVGWVPQHYTVEIIDTPAVE